jgi:hypothetical protein
MWNAQLIHGPNKAKSDTYRLVSKTESGEEYIDIPGWMVGDIEGSEERRRAADIIRARLFGNLL